MYFFAVRNILFAPTSPAHCTKNKIVFVEIMEIFMALDHKAFICCNDFLVLSFSCWCFESFFLNVSYVFSSELHVLRFYIFI